MIYQWLIPATNSCTDEGIVLCADICNTSLTFGLKKKSRIKYINLLEVFGIDPDKAGRRMNDIAEVEKAAQESGLSYSIVPHSAYSVSLPLFSTDKGKIIRKYCHLHSFHGDR